MAYLQRLSDAGSLSEPLKNLIDCLQAERSSYGKNIWLVTISH